MKKNMVPTLMFHGTADELVGYKIQFLPFIEKMKSLKNIFTYHTFEGIGHFWFREPKSAEISAKMTDEFLISLGYIEQK
jgi:alpha-beta hydrolase superfamily lysophospholipase